MRKQENPLRSIVFMMNQLFFCIILLELEALLVECTDLPLNGTALRILPFQFPGLFLIKRNSSGYIIEMKGVLPPIIDWLAVKYNFKYTLLQNFAPHTMDSSLGRGALSYVQSGEADLVLGGILASSIYVGTVDYSATWTDIITSFLIPYPTSSENIEAIVKPFQIEIWILLLAAFPVMIAALYGLSRGVAKLSAVKDRALKFCDRSDGFETMSKAFDYVVDVFFSRGAFCPSKKLAIRLAAGSWCLACFVLITAYSSVLVSYIVSPNLKPIIQSIHDIPKVPGLQVVTVKGSTIERVMSLAPNGSIYKEVADQWRMDPSLMLASREKCVEQVKTSRNRIFPEGITILASLANRDNPNSECSVTIAKIPYTSPGLTLALPKNSPYTESISRGILELRQYGLIQHWEKSLVPTPDDCLTYKYQEKQTTNKTRISLKNLSGAFLILGVGLNIAFFVFLVEKIVNYHKKNSNH